MLRYPRCFERDGGYTVKSSGVCYGSWRAGEGLALPVVERWQSAAAVASRRAPSTFMRCARLGCYFLSCWRDKRTRHVRLSCLVGWFQTSSFGLEWFGVLAPRGLIPRRHFCCTIMSLRRGGRARSRLEKEHAGFAFSIRRTVDSEKIVVSRTF